MERVKRNKLAKKNIDLSKPFDLALIGTEDDPCFGKHHDSTKSACQQCGDAEFCAIATAQRLKTTRMQIESGTTFKDIEPSEVIDYKTCKAWVKEQLKDGKKPLEDLKKEGIEYLHIGPYLWDKYIDRMIERAPDIFISKSGTHLIYKP